MLHGHLDTFRNNTGAYLEEQVQRFHQDVMNFRRRYQGQFNKNVVGFSKRK